MIWLRLQSGVSRGGLSYEQIAKEEGCSKVAVKYSIDKAVKKLKEILK